MAADAVDNAVIQLFRAAKSVHGEYDGWSANCCWTLVPTNA